MYGSSLITCVWEHLRDCFRHTQVLISDYETHSAKSSLLKPYKEKTPAFLILFHPSHSTDDLTATVFPDTDSHKDRYILYLTAPAALEVDTVYIDIRISARKREGTPLFDMLIGFFVEAAYRTG